MIKLFLVEITKRIIVIASDEHEAIDIAETNERHEGGESVATQIHKKEDIPREWLEAIPYGDWRGEDQNDKTTADLLKEISEEGK